MGSWNHSCILCASGVTSVVMKPAARKQKKLDYPDETEGSRIAAKTRKLASKLTPEQRREFIRRAMVRIYGGQPKEAALPGH